MAKTDPCECGPIADIEQVARAHSEAAVNILVRIMSDAEATASARISAANAVLDRAWGKVQTSVKRAGKRNIGDLSDEELVQLIWDGAGNGGIVGKTARKKKL